MIWTTASNRIVERENKMGQESILKPVVTAFQKVKYLYDGGRSQSHVTINIDEQQFLMHTGCMAGLNGSPPRDISSTPNCWMSRVAPQQSDKRTPIRDPLKISILLLAGIFTPHWAHACLASKARCEPYQYPIIGRGKDTNLVGKDERDAKHVASRIVRMDLDGLLDVGGYEGPEHFDSVVARMLTVDSSEWLKKREKSKIGRSGSGQARRTRVVVCDKIRMKNWDYNAEVTDVVYEFIRLAKFTSDTVSGDSILKGSVLGLDQGEAIQVKYRMRRIGKEWKLADAQYTDVGSPESVRNWLSFTKTLSEARGYSAGTKEFWTSIRESLSNQRSRLCK